MLDELNEYQKYRPSECTWVDSAPAHWSSKRLDRLFTLRMEAPEPADGRVTGYLGGRVTLRTNVASQKIKGVVKDGGWIRVHPGDLAISGMNAHLGGIGVSDSLGKCSPIYLILEPRITTNAHYVAQLLRHIAAVGAVKSLVNTIRYNSADFKRDVLKLFELPIPPLEEQEAIVRFLDWANGRLERVIRGKRRVIALLTEQKQAIIHRAVTRGLDPSVPLKPSGIPWLGDIPAHWKIERNMALFSHRVERGVPGLPVLQVSLRTGISEESTTLGGRQKRLIANHERYKLLKANDIAYNTMRMWQGAVGVAETSGLVSPAYVVIAPRPSAHSPFYELVFRTAAYKQEVNRVSTGIVSDRNRLYWDSFKDMPNLVPPIEEQIGIVGSVKIQTGSLDHTISKMLRDIELLGEYRTRLTADVVTGKLDVREAAKNLSVELEIDPVDDSAGDDELEIDDEEAVA
jgi:type I restriction enzyme, S subunit